MEDQIPIPRSYEEAVRHPLRLKERGRGILVSAFLTPGGILAVPDSVSDDQISAGGNGDSHRRMNYKTEATYACNTSTICGQSFSRTFRSGGAVCFLLVLYINVRRPQACVLSYKNRQPDIKPDINLQAV